MSHRPELLDSPAPQLLVPQAPSDWPDGSTIRDPKKSGRRQLRLFTPFFFLVSLARPFTSFSSPSITFSYIPPSSQLPSSTLLRTGVALRI